MKKKIPLILLFGCLAAAAGGLMELFQLRFEAGDVYPKYSSLRADPLGTMAFYESLDRLPGVAVRRDFSDANRLPEESRTVYLHLAAYRHDWQWVPKDLFAELERFQARGGRLVITFFPQTESSAFFYEHRNETNTVKSASDRDKKMTPDKKTKMRNKTEEAEGVQLEDRWGVHTRFEKMEQADGVYAPVRVTNRTDLPLPRVLNWHSGIVFANLDDAWRVIYARGTNAVVIERRFGKGSVVMATDSYFVSNEAVARDRHADLLAWLIGPGRNVVFDEAHLGVVETSGVVVLMRQYRLHGLAAGLLLLAGLFVWKNTLSLVPPHPDAQQTGYVAGKDAAAGFVNLLRRNIASRDLLSACFAEWKKSAAGVARPTDARVREAEQLVATENSRPSRDRNPVAAYRKICSLLKIHNSSSPS
jgi:hypothetical protein